MHHLQYNGTVTRIIQGPLGNSTNKIRVNGRVVVDTAAYRRFNPNSPEFAMVAMSHPAGGHRAGRGRRNLGLFDQPPPPAAYDIYGDPIPAASRKESAVIKELDEVRLVSVPASYLIKVVHRIRCTTVRQSCTVSLSLRKNGAPSPSKT